MDISLVAKMKKYDEFISCYNEGDEKKLYKGKSLLFCKYVIICTLPF